MDRYRTKLRNYALWSLERYGVASTARLRERLRKRLAKWLEADDGSPAVDDGLIDQLVIELCEMGLVDDHKLAASRTRKLLDRGWSIAKIRQDLRQRQMPAYAIAAALDIEPDAEFAAACRFAQRRRLGPWRLDPVGPDLLQSELRKFAGRGFSYTVAKRIIDAESDEELLR